ncbi:LEM3 (ligand-effect modulator 3) family / CDC50 family [Babesia microti strain RI]|uniref:LEM3 (Ligand-effect modulator 3) family / CDC50 family n=1 Tax=Babesia microti (strain RI) TaxID=1133968 RepID=A0A1R4ABE7_BABMR|nr:LEM3 (ligand-effect modulator 3) family / CDC50 family [Babesia microti strain RI]SJK86316.1 LEM3 (ligand-effect modulator 3) family / CDC50 family [Babesia microti strain RI]|eukprot:XP_012648843.2 LEM3 (ligand-effect modulator 3) family / CDC50 family [Babesia microti strain RI]
MSSQSRPSNISDTVKYTNKAIGISASGFKFGIFRKNVKVRSGQMRGYVSAYKQFPLKYHNVYSQIVCTQSENYIPKLNKRYSWTEKVVKILEWDIRDGVYMQRRSAPILILFIFILAINICISSLLWTRKVNFVECEIPYHQQPVGNPTFVTIKVTHKECNKDDKFALLEADDIFVYYKITNYPHLESSLSNGIVQEQLAGNVISDSKQLHNCAPLDSIEHKGVKKILHPCGIHAWNVFNDKIRFYRSSPTGSLAASIEIDESVPTSAMPLEIQHFKNPTQDIVDKHKQHTYFWMLPENEDSKEMDDDECLANMLYDALNYEKCGIGVENSHFAIWMSGTSFSNIKNYYGKLKGPLELPLYMSIENRYNVAKFNGTKSIILSIPRWPYGSSLSLEILHLVFTILTLLFTVIYATRNTNSSTFLQMYHESKIRNNKK